MRRTAFMSEVLMAPQKTTRLAFAFCVFLAIFEIRSSSPTPTNNTTLRDNFVELTFESNPEKSQVQKHYVELLNAKLLAHGREIIEKNELLNNYERSSDEIFVKDRNPSQLISSYLRRISNVKLGVTSMQEIYDSLPLLDIEEDVTEVIKEVSRKMLKKISNYLKILEANKHYMEENFSSADHSLVFDDLHCCDVPNEMLQYDEHFGVEITRATGCKNFLFNNDTGNFSSKSFLTPALKHNLESFPTLLWQYFISLVGVHFEYPAHNTNHLTDKCGMFSDRHREVFQSSITSPKLVIIVIEQGYSLSTYQFVTAKAVAKHILGLLTSNDRVVVVGLAADVQYVFPANCSAGRTHHATFDAKTLLTRFIDNLDRKQNITNHVLGFQTIYEIIAKYEQSNGTVSNDVLITYISRGLLSSLIDAKQVLETIADGNRKSKFTIVINTYAIVDGEKPVMLEKEFLKCVAEQNFKNYNIHFKNRQKIKEGVMVPINSTANLAENVGNIFAAFPQNIVVEPMISLPNFDSLSKGMIISLSRQVVHDQKLVGIVGIDISLNDIAEDCLLYYNQKKSNYLFLLDSNGIAILHPSLSSPPYTHEHNTHTSALYLEDMPRFETIFKLILSNPSGQEMLQTKVLNSSLESNSESYVLYTWQRVEGTPYTVVMRTKAEHVQKKMLQDTVVPEIVRFMYHRLDLVPASNICRHMKQLSSLGSSALFLSASCFNMPYKYLVEEETKQMVQNYMAYLTDTTKLIANPGLKAGIRSEVLAVSWITPTWEKATEDDEFSNYVVRRFIATTSGVFQVYPATLIEKMYDATRRDWYIRALDHPGKIILTAPYLDIGGAGYVITLSHTIYEGKPAALHSSSDKVSAVMGMDFTFGYFYKLLLDKVAVCKDEKIVCFLLDDRGYLIAHPDLIEPSGRGPVEQQHVTHKEPLVANDLLNHKEFITKKVCNSFSDRTIQRFYQLNTTLSGVLTNQVHGEHCTKYQIMAIKGTNIFLGIVNRTCDGITAFCPCSMTDRLCLNCHRMEPTECECPCECPLEMDMCFGQLLDNNNRYPTCRQFPEEPNLPLVDNILLESLQPCYEYHCSSRSELGDCFGILGCEWCQLETDGITPLLNKFCTEQRKCFGGVLGARTPYADEIIEGLTTEQFLIFKSPIGPVAGGFMVFFIAVALGVYCYRNHVRRGTTAHHSVSVPDTNLRMAQLNNEPDEPDLFQELAPSCQLYPQVENIISPYRVHTNYRRPPGGDSDHGYSTMTPHEDSEHAPYFEPLLISKDKHFAPTSQQSLSSCSQSSTPSSQYPHGGIPPMTSLPSPSKMKLDHLAWFPKKEVVSQLSTPPGSFVIAQVEVHSENVH